MGRAKTTMPNLDEGPAENITRWISLPGLLHRQSKAVARSLGVAISVIILAEPWAKLNIDIRSDRFQKYRVFSAMARCRPR